MYEPLRITAWPRAPIATDGSLPLDGPLFDLAMREAYGRLEVSTPGAPPAVPDTPLSLAKRGEDNLWYYAVSWAQWEGSVAHTTLYWTKKYESRRDHLIDFEGRRGKVIIEQGRYKGYRMSLFCRHALRVIWYAVGDGAEIERLLHFADAVGKKHRAGNGAIARWRVEQWHADWSVHGEDGRLMRAVPSSQGIRMGVRPSYWLPKNQLICEVPG